jgi:hypothetical protein
MHLFDEVIIITGLYCFACRQTSSVVYLDVIADNHQFGSLSTHSVPSCFACRLTVCIYRRHHNQSIPVYLSNIILLIIEQLRH